MKNNRVVIINGQAYDSVTGLPVAQTDPIAPSKLRKNFQDIKSVSKITRPAVKTAITAQPKPVNMLQTGRQMDISKNSRVTHFAKTYREAIKSAAARSNADIAPVKHPLISGAKRPLVKLIKKRPAPKTSQQIKEEAIEEALSRPRVVQPKTKRKMSRRTKIVSIFAVCFILLLGACCAVYLFTPSLSVRFASVQAGINAKYPEYIPDGYGVDGPVSYSDKQVTINFKANAGNTHYSITQTKSAWDSSALKDKIETDSKGEFNITTLNGLTIYTYDSSAAWVNGGILYRISGDAHLLLSQIQKIATNL